MPLPRCGDPARSVRVAGAEEGAWMPRRHGTVEASERFAANDSAREALRGTMTESMRHSPGPFRTGLARFEWVRSARKPNGPSTHSGLRGYERYFREDPPPLDAPDVRKRMAEFVDRYCRRRARDQHPARKRSAEREPAIANPAVELRLASDRSAAHQVSG
jgi:hypothetical protein